MVSHPSQEKNTKEYAKVNKQAFNGNNGESETRAKSKGGSHQLSYREQRTSIMDGKLKSENARRAFLPTPPGSCLTEFTQC